MIKLANRIESLKMQEDDGSETPGQSDMPSDSTAAAGDAMSGKATGKPHPPAEIGAASKKLRDVAKGAIFREVVLAKVKEMKEQEKSLTVEREAKERESKNKVQKS
jgi:calcium/calmodulin-dependent protein kinase I